MDKVLLVRIERQGWFLRYPRGVPLLMFLICVASTLLSVLVIERSEYQRRQVALDRDLTEIASGVEQRVAEHVAVLRAAAALFSASGDVTRADFEQFAKSVYPRNDFRGSLGLGLARWIDAASVPAF